MKVCQTLNDDWSEKVLRSQVIIITANLSLWAARM